VPALTFKEEPLQLGEGGRLFGILSEPVAKPVGHEERPVFLLLNAGLLHRVGPSRLHVQMAREFARMGFTSLRVDLSGKGDSPARGSMTNRESVARDFDDICAGLKSRYGSPSLALAGLCSGADNAVRLCAREPGVKGLLLLDPICFPDPGFRRRALAGKYLSVSPYIRKVQQMLKPAPRTGPGEPRENGDDPMMLRDLPSLEQMRHSFALIGERKGSVLSIFTQYALKYYNAAGQLAAALQMDNYRAFCVERFWPDVEHTYKLEIHRERLLREVTTWAGSLS
jgi:hypothetical protein